MNRHTQQIGSALRGFIRAAALVASCTAASAGTASTVRFNEIDVHKVDSSIALPNPAHWVDTREFIELKGAPNASLAGHMRLVVDGDSTNAGVLDRAIDLGAFALPVSGYFVLGDSALVPKDFDLGAYDQIENGTTTFYLVTTTNQTALNALVGTRVNAAGNTTVIGTLATIVDSVAIADADH